MFSIRLDEFPERVSSSIQKTIDWEGGWPLAPTDGLSKATHIRASPVASMIAVEWEGLQISDRGWLTHVVSASACVHPHREIQSFCGIPHSSLRAASAPKKRPRHDHRLGFCAPAIRYPTCRS